MAAKSPAFVYCAKFSAFLAALLVLFLASPGLAATGKILFYEVQAPATMRITGSGYTSFNGLIQGAGYSTASISSADVKLTQEKLKEYDVVIMQGLNKALDTEEILALRWYVGVQGGGLLINGDEPDGVNNLGQIYGILMDKSSTWIVDTANFPFNTSGTSIASGEQKYYALVREFPDKTDAQGLRMSGVGKIGIYKAHPLFVESVRVNSPIGKTKVIATGSNLSYTETGTFPVGSQPPIAARAFFGAGAVIVFSDFDMLSDAHIFDRDFANETINNDAFGLAAVEWLANKDNRELSVQNESELAIKVLQLQSRNIALEAANSSLWSERALLRANLSSTITSYEGNLSATRAEAQKEVTRCETKLGICNSEGLKNMAIGGGIGLVVAIIAAAGIVISVRMKKPSSKKPGDVGKDCKPPASGTTAAAAAEPAAAKAKAKETGRQETLEEAEGGKKASAQAEIEEVR